MTDKKPTDWERIELDYRAGILSVREIAEARGVSHTAIYKKAKTLGWEREPRKVITSPVRLDSDQWGVAGFIYVIYLDDSAGQRFYKIGMASAFTPRFATHQCASPFAICVACAYYVGNMRAEERELHQLFSEGRVRGEWFSLSDEDLSVIAKRAKLV